MNSLILWLLTILSLSTFSIFGHTSRTSFTDAELFTTPEYIYVPHLYEIEPWRQLYTQLRNLDNYLMSKMGIYYFSPILQLNCLHDFRIRCLKVHSDLHIREETDLVSFVGVVLKWIRDDDSLFSSLENRVEIVDQLQNFTNNQYGVIASRLGQLADILSSELSEAQKLDRFESLQVDKFFKPSLDYFLAWYLWIFQQQKVFALEEALAPVLASFQRIIDHFIVKDVNLESVPRINYYEMVELTAHNIVSEIQSFYETVPVDKAISQAVASLKLSVSRCKEVSVSNHMIIVYKMYALHASFKSIENDGDRLLEIFQSIHNFHMDCRPFWLSFINSFCLEDTTNEHMPSLDFIAAYKQYNHFDDDRCLFFAQRRLDDFSEMYQYFNVELHCLLRLICKLISNGERLKLDWFQQKLWPGEY